MDSKASQLPANPNRIHAIEMMELETPEIELAVTSPLRHTPAEERRGTFASKFRHISVEHPPTKSPMGYSSRVLGLCCVLPVAGIGGAACFLFLLAIANCIPIAMIVLGVKYLQPHFCPVSKLPLLLIVGGSVTLASSLLESICRLVLKLSKTAPGEKKIYPCVLFLCLILRLASFGWFITASVMVYRAYDDVTFDSSDDINYCHPVLYTFAFWLITIGLILVGVCTAILCASCLCLLCIKK